MRLFLVAGLFVTFAAEPTLNAQRSSARDAFWSARDLVSVSANPGAKSSTTSSVKHKDLKIASTSKPVSGPQHVDPILVASNGYGQQPHLLRVSSEQIGLRYSLLLRDAAGNYLETSPAATFHSGDYLKLSVMANQPGYLYVVQQGSSGSWSAIFPAKGSAAETNKVEQGRVVEIPGGKGAFQFNTTPGQEKLFIVLSRNPIQDLDSLTTGLKNPGPAAPQQRANAPDNTVYEAANHTPDEFIRRFSSRDLNLVEVEDPHDAKKADGLGEKAVYVVSKGAAGPAGPQVVASLTMSHE